MTKNYTNSGKLTFFYHLCDVFKKKKKKDMHKSERFKSIIRSNILNGLDKYRIFLFKLFSI